MATLKRYSGSAWEPVVGAAQSGSSVVSVDNPPASPHADNYEFDATSSSLPSGWSWVNQGTSTYTEANGAGALLQQVKTGTYDWRGIVRNVPAGASWTATMKIEGMGATLLGGSPAVSFIKALVLRQSSDGKMIVMSNYRDNNIYLERWTSATAHSASITTTFQPYAQWNVRYWRIRKNSSTSWDFQVSNDGSCWMTMSAAYDASAFLTPDQIGFAAMSDTVAGTVAAHWYRVG